MSLEILNQLEEKIKQAVETIQLLQLEVEELKEQKNQAQKTNTIIRKNIIVHYSANLRLFNQIKRLRKSKPFLFKDFYENLYSFR